MPAIGRPDHIKRSFADVKIHRDRSHDLVEKNPGDRLNEIAGRKKKEKEVNSDTHNKMGKDEFLKILSYQLSNQDPMNPTDQKKFAADLAQFASLEQLSNLNGKFDRLDDDRPLENKFHGVGFLGREVITGGRSVEYKGESAWIPFHLTHPAKELRIRLFDKNNQMIGELMKKNRPQGEQEVLWDGSRLDGGQASHGSYRVEITGWDEQFNPFDVNSKSRGLVTGVNFEDGRTVLIVDGKKKVHLQDVESFRLPVHNERKDAKHNIQSKSIVP